MDVYASRIRGALKDAVDARKLAEAWAALHPADFGAAKAVSPILSQFLERAAAAIQRALAAVLPGAWTEGWVLGQQSARALVADLAAVDWAGWEPGDPDAAAEVAGQGLAQLLADQGIRIQSIAQSRLDELGDVLAEYLSSSEIIRPLTGPVPPVFSVDALERALQGVLDNPSRSYMVAQSEIARAQGMAAEWSFRQMGVAREEISTAGDARVCPACDAAAKAGPQPVGTYSLGLHPLCRCAKIPVLAGAS